MNLITTSYKPYIKLARLNRPVGTWLLLLPSWWGISLASPSWPPLYLLVLFACGALLMRSAGCVYNDMVDQDLDRKVSRTANRPLANGNLSSKQALLFLGILLSLSALILFSLPLPVIITGFIALGLVFLYPWMKRITYWPQVFLGLTFNIGILMGWLCLQPTLSWTPFLIYGGALFWTLGYDTIYAFQDREDDLLAGVKSSALKVSPAPKIFLGLVYGLAVTLWAIGGLAAKLGWIYGLFLCIISLHLAWQVFSLRENDGNNCYQRFASNTKVGLLLFLGIVFSRVIN